MKTIIVIGMLLIASICYADWQDFNRNISGGQFEDNRRSDTVYLESNGVMIPVTVPVGGSKYVQTSESSTLVRNFANTISIQDSKRGSQMIYKQR
jgi:hypothetical protein